MGRQLRPSPIFAVFVIILILFFGIVGLVSAGANGVSPAATSDSQNMAETTPPSENNESVNCERCHGSIETNSTERVLHNEVTNQPDHEFELHHGEDQWCFACHATENRDELRLPNGSTVEWTDSNETRLCGSCHGPVYNDWEAHIHGKWTGSWQNATADKECIDCHNPHDPEFEPIEPEPAPEEPPSGPTVAQAVLPSGYYVGVGSMGALLIGLIAYAATGLKND